MQTNNLTAPGNLFILAAPSGAGKSSLIRALLKRHPEHAMQVSVSCTTRAKRPGEEDGVDYHFLSKAEFERKIANDEFYEWAQVFDNYYGTSRTVIENTLQRGHDVFLDIDWQGARQVRAAQPDVTTIFIMPPSLTVLEERLRKRGQDSDQVIAKRMSKAQAEMSHYHEFDLLIVNDDFEQSLLALEHIVFGQRQRMAIQQVRYAATIKDLLANGG